MAHVAALSVWGVVGASYVVRAVPHRRLCADHLQRQAGD